MTKIRSLDENSDLKYLEDIRNGDHLAFTSLYRKYFKLLVLAANKYVKEVGVAKEIVQDIFLKLWEQPYQFDSTTSLKSYLYRSVVNASLNHVKREKNITQHHLKIASEATYDSIETLHDENKLKLLIYSEIELLPAQCKKVFKMSRFDGLKYKEIAIALDISEKTVENHMMKALKTLRERLYDKNPSDNLYKLKFFCLFMLGAEFLINTPPNFK